jgi:hypothetical protein
MTPGIIYVITNDGVYNSPRFSNDMNPFFLINGNGLYAIAHLVKVTDIISFGKAIFEFVKECYGDEQILSIPDISPEETDDTLDFAQIKYPDDWIFVKNVSSKRYPYGDRDGTLHYIKPGHIRVFEFGHYKKNIMHKLFNEARQRNDIPSADLVHTIPWEGID